MQTPNQEHITINLADLASSVRADVIRVLHVDDDPCILSVSKEILMTEGNFEIEHASCVDEAFKKLRARIYDVVISDYEMPQKDGLQFLKELREQKNKIPFILFTGKGREEVVIRALNLGADFYVNKQGSPETVYGELSHSLRASAERSKTELRNVNAALALRSVQEGIVTSDENFIITAWNKGAKEMFGWRAREVIGKKIDDVFNCIQVIPTIKEVIGVVKEEGQFKGEVIYQDKNGQKHNGELDVVSIITKSGEFLGNVAVCHEITERKKAEEALKQSEAKLRSIVENSSDQILMVDRNSKYLTVNKMLAEVLGKPVDKIIGKSVSEVYPESGPQFIKNLEIVFSSGRKLVIDEKMVAQNKEYINSTSLNPVKDDDGNIIAVTGIVRDITERKRAEEMLHESEQRWATTLASIGDAVIATDNSGKITFMNAEAEKLSGWTLIEAKQKPVNQVFKIINKRTRLEVNDPVAKVLATGQVTGLANNTILLRKDGSEAAIDDSAAPIKDAEGKVTGVVLVFRDVTESKKALEMVNFQATLLNHVGQAIMMVDKDGRIRFWNGAAEKLFGLTGKEVLDRQIVEIMGNATSREEAEAITMKLEAGETWSAELQAKRRDGSLVPVIVNRAPIFDDEGVYVGAAAIVTDITDQKRMQTDLAIALDSLSCNMDKIQTLNEKLRVVGSLTRHDVANKLGVVTNYSYILKKRHADQADIVDGLDKIVQAVNSSMKIFDFAKMYEQLGAEELTLIDSKQAVDQALGFFSDPLKFKVINECNGLSVLADSFLRQMFYNLMDNTRKYSEKATIARVHYESASERFLRLIYEDDGIGVSNENKLKLFKEGFSTGGCTGFGLFLIKKMMEVYGWAIEENGEMGKGARFQITIPKLSSNGKENYQIARKEPMG